MTAPFLSKPLNLRVMTQFEIYTKFKDIETLCKIALTHATPTTLAEVVGPSSGRTVEDMFRDIKSLSEECRECIKKDMGW